MMFRAWWRWRHPPPPLPPTLARHEAALAQLTHFTLYGLLLVMPLAGYLSTAAAGHAVSVFGVVSIPPLLSENNRWSHDRLSSASWHRGIPRQLLEERLA